MFRVDGHTSKPEVFSPSVADAEKTLAYFRVDSATGPDQLPARILKHCETIGDAIAGLLKIIGAGKSLESLIQALM